MGGRGSGRPALPAELHVLRGTYRGDRHGPAVRPASKPPREITPGDRVAVLDGLDPEGRRVAASLLDAYADWSPAALVTLRQYAISCGRLAVLTDDSERRREVRSMLALLRALALEG
jgi:hypothetical protein